MIFMSYRQAVASLAVILAFSIPADSQHATPNHWEGYLIDLTCARERKDKEPGLGAAHTKNCLTMPVCDRSGFGLLSPTNEVWRFDEEGNRKVRALIAKTKKEVKLRIVVGGIKSGETIAVRQIELR
jgi:hypothetical protein